MSKLRTAVLGASGMVGQRFCEMLSGHPFFDVPSIYASERSGGKILSDAISIPEPRISDELLRSRIEPLDTGVIAREKYDAVFSALPSSAASAVEIEMMSMGCRIFTNASPNRMRPDVPLVVPEVNHEHLELVKERKGFIVANGNCSSIGLAMGLKPIDSLGLKRVEVTTMQALSGAGYPGVPSMDSAANVLPFIDAEEEKLAQEIPKMLGSLANGSLRPSGVVVNATCTRVPVRDGHMESVMVETERSPDAAEVEEMFRSFTSLPQEMSLPTAPSRPVIYRKENNRPQPLLDVNAGSPARARGMAATVGRLRVQPHMVRFMILTHNTIRGAAGGSVLNAELLHAKGVI